MAVEGAGELRHRLTLQVDQGTRDGLGEQVPDWQDVTTVYAKVEPLSGREYWQAAQTQSDVTHKITIRYRTGLTSRHRFLWGTRIFNFTEVPRDLEEKHEWLEVMTREEEPSREE